MEVEFGQGFGLNAIPRMPGRKIRKTHIGKIESLLSTLCRVLNLNFQIKKGAGERKVEWSENFTLHTHVPSKVHTL